MQHSHTMRFNGEKLRDLRKARSWGQHELAEAARGFASGITQAQVSRYENGQQPSGRNALALAMALGVAVTDLYSVADAPLPSTPTLLEILYAQIGDALGVKA